MIAMAAATTTVMGDKSGALLQAGAIGPIYRDIAGTILHPGARGREGRALPPKERRCATHMTSWFVPPIVVPC